jgi:hypothetical protein
MPPQHPRMALRLLINWQSRPPRGKCYQMALKLSQHETGVSRWDLWQRELAPFAHGAIRGSVFSC